jgi:hypothetical protein
VRKAKRDGKSVAQKTKSAVTRLGAYRVIHFGLRGKGIKENVPMPACVVADLRARFPDTGARARCAVGGRGMTSMLSRIEVMHEDDADVRDAGALCAVAHCRVVLIVYVCSCGRAS